MSDLPIVLLDNIDSFTWNLVDEFARRGAAVSVIRNDSPADTVLDLVRSTGARLLVISPGPGTPKDAGCCLPVVRQALGTVPIFGVCLGHQALIDAAGGIVSRAPAAMHGKASMVRHDGSAPFAGLPSPMPVGRYHSLAGSAIPERLTVTATAGDVVMGVSHRDAPAVGIQFHPESVLTPHGGALLANVLTWAAAHAAR